MKKLKKLLVLTVLTAISLTTFNCIKDKDTDTLPKYTVIFDTNGGTFDTDGGNEIQTIQITEGDKVTKPTNPTKEGYNFVEWRKEGETTAFDFNIPVFLYLKKNITLQAVWSIKQITITFDTDGGNKIDPVTINYNELVTEPTKPTKEGIGVTFLEWRKDDETIKFDFNTPITSDITLKAIWSDKPIFTVTFDEGGTTPVFEEKVLEGDKVIKPTDPTKEGHSFVEWRKDGETIAFDFNTLITNDITLKAVWSKHEFTVTFNTDGGTPVSSTEKVLYGEKVTKPTDPIKSGYTFVEWQLEGQVFDFTTLIITGNITLKAIWSDKQVFTVTFDTDGETPASFTEKVLYGENVTKPTDPTKDQGIY